MARYIDADRFKSNLERASEKMHLIGGVKGVDIGAVITALDRQPTADVAPKSEWISVEDDTPKNQMARVLVFLRSEEATDSIGFPKIDTDRYVNGKWVRWSRWVTHWMPLPEPPKTKGE